MTGRSRRPSHRHSLPLIPGGPSCAIEASHTLPLHCPLQPTEGVPSRSTYLHLNFGYEDTPKKKAYTKLVFKSGLAEKQRKTIPASRPYNYKTTFRPSRRRSSGEYSGRMSRVCPVNINTDKIHTITSSRASMWRQPVSGNFISRVRERDPI